MKFAAIRLVLIIVVVAAAMAAPFKHLDQQTKIDSPCVTLAAAAKAARWRSDRLPQGALERQICVSSTTPTLRELQSALERSGVTARYGYCGNGATILLGAHPIGTAALKAKW